jgi:xylulokinase
VVSSDKYVLAIDMGSGSAKAALISSHGEIAAAALRTIETRILPGGGAEQDPEQWWDAVSDATHSALSQSAVPPARIIAIACTAQWGVTVPIGERGDPLSNAISWMDTRGGPYNRAVVAGWPRINGYGLSKLVKWIRLAGGVPVQSGVDGLGHILFLKHERPEIYARTKVFLEPMDYINLRLTGRPAASYGTIFPYWLTDNRDPHDVHYVPELLRLAGVDRTKMPDLFPVDAVLGEIKPKVADELGLMPGTKVVMGSCDSHAATVGAGAVHDYEGYFYIGSTSWLSCHVPAKKTDPLHMISTMPAALPGRYMVAAEQGMAGRCLEFLKDFLFPEGDATTQPPANMYEYLNGLAAQAPAGCD